MVSPADELDVSTLEEEAVPAGGPARTGRKRRKRRPSRWDRPKPPKDWRYFVGGLGRILIAAGVLLFAFVAYQLWGTGIEEAQSQRQLENQFEDLVADLATSSTSSTATTAPSTTTPPAPTTTSPGEVAPPPETIPQTVSPTAPPPRIETTPAQLMPAVNPGDPLAIINMPTIGVEKVVVASVEVGALKKGPGHFSQTPLPGQLGNAGIAGHRTTYGAPFFSVDELAVGDPIVVTTPFGTYTYRVTGQTIVGAADGYVLGTTDPERATLTLVSCHPRYTARNRLIVFADLDESISSPVGQPLFQYVPLPGPGEAPDPVVAELPAEEVPGDEVPGDEDAPVAQDPLVDDPATDDPAVDDPATDDPAVDEAALDDPAVDDSTAEAEIEDAFGRGWFSDPDAWPPVMWWGLVLILISVLATQVSRLARRNWVGLLVGIVPFVVVLYFWFQNVNRLLPPSL